MIEIRYDGRKPRPRADPDETPSRPHDNKLRIAVDPDEIPSPPHDNKLRIAVDPDEIPSRPHDNNLRIAADPDETPSRPHVSNLRIAVDFDGVLFDHVPYVLRGFRDAHGVDLAAEGLRHWDFFQYRAVRERRLTWDCVHAVLHDIETDPALHLEAPRDTDARHVMAAWRAMGHEVSIVTARHEASRACTELFLRAHGIPHDHLRMGVSLKTGYDVLVDDAPHNVLTAAASGTRALLMDQPYNRDVPTRGNPRRVYTWRQVARVVDAHADALATAPTRATRAAHPLGAEA